ncbi:LEC14B protein [Tanacetum coccineum]
MTVLTPSYHAESFAGRKHVRLLPSYRLLPSWSLVLIGASELSSGFWLTLRSQKILCSCENEGNTTGIHLYGRRLEKLSDKKTCNEESKEDEQDNSIKQVTKNVRLKVSEHTMLPTKQAVVYSSMSPIVHIVNIESAMTESVANVTEMHEGLDFSGYENGDDDANKINVRILAHSADVFLLMKLVTFYILGVMITFVSAADYVAAQRLRRMIMYYHMEIFKNVDVIVTLTTGYASLVYPCVEFCKSEMKVQCSHNSRICELALPSKRPKQQDVPKRARLRESIRQK